MGQRSVGASASTLLRSEGEMTRDFMLNRQSGVNGLLDVARQNFKEVTSDVFTLLHAYKSNFFNSKDSQTRSIRYTYGSQI